MSDETTPGLTNEPAGDKLGTIINEAIATHTSESAVEPQPDAGEITKDDNRDPATGRYVPKDTTAKAPDTGSADAVKADASQAAQPVEGQPLEPPARWTEADKATFAKLPRDAQQVLLERNRATEADYTRKTQEIAEFRKSADPLIQAVQPYAQYLAQVGMTPHQAVNMLLGAEYSLRTGTLDQKYQALAKIAGDYGIDLAALSRGEVAQPDPAFTQQRQQIQALEQRLAQYEQNQTLEQNRQVKQEIEAFATAKDETGRLKYPHFERFAGVIGHLLATNKAANLSDAYQMATEPLNTAVAEELQTRQSQAEKQRQDALDKAKKAAPLKTPSGTQPNGSVTQQGLDAHISAAMAKHGMA